MNCISWCAIWRWGDEEVGDVVVGIRRSIYPLAPRRWMFPGSDSIGVRTIETASCLTSFVENGLVFSGMDFSAQARLDRSDY